MRRPTVILGSATRRRLWLWRRGDERGLLSTELAVILFPFIVGCVGIVTYAGRLAQAEGDVQQAAQQAARAASLTGNPATAVSVATATAEQNLATARVGCARGHTVTVDPNGLTPGGFVRVTVTCVADLSDVARLGVPGSHTFTASATEIIDFYRSSNP